MLSKVIFHQINIKNKLLWLIVIKKKENVNDEGDSISDSFYDDDNDDDGIFDNKAGNNGDINYGNDNDDVGDVDTSGDGNDIDYGDCGDIGGGDINDGDDEDNDNGDVNKVTGSNTDDIFDGVCAGDGNIKVDLGTVESGGGKWWCNDVGGVNDVGCVDTNGGHDAKYSKSDSKVDCSNGLDGVCVSYDDDIDDHHDNDSTIGNGANCCDSKYSADTAVDVNSVADGGSNNNGGVDSDGTSQKMKFSFKDLFGKCDLICSNVRIWSHLLRKSLIGNFIFCAVWWE